MDERLRVVIGHGALGLALGLFLHPWIYLYTVREGIAEPRDPLWATIFYALILAPAVLLILLGMGRTRSPTA